MTKDKEEKVVADRDTNIDDINVTINEVKKDKKNNVSYLFLSRFLKRLKEDKLYFISFIITLLFIFMFSIGKVRQAEGIYSNVKNEIEENNVTPSVDATLNEKDTIEEIDVTNYVGIYSKVVMMNSPVVLNDTCSITNYKLVYQIKKDKSITKYLVSDCVGTIKIWNDTLAYVTNSGARYISANNINYLFSGSALKEVDGETYKIDEDITSIKEKNKFFEGNVYFYNNDIVFRTNNNLFLVRNSDIVYDLSKNYPNNGGDLKQRIYESASDNQFNFIVFNNNEGKNCYTEDEVNDGEFIDGENYKILKIKYNFSTKTFDEAEEIVTRKKSDFCSLYKEDLELLKK